MHRRRLVVLSAALAATPVAVVACGDGGGEVAGTLPAIATTTTSSVLATTTTVYVEQTYEVQSGDNLTAIARRLGVSISDLMALNGIVNPDQVQAGQVLKVPPPTVPVDPSSTSSAPPL